MYMNFTSLITPFIFISVLLLSFVILYIDIQGYPKVYADEESFDKFGTREIYPTKEGGREWYVNMENPKNDTRFMITFNPNITREHDGSWRISEPVVRMNVNTLPGSSQWKNVEITGYAKVVGLIPNSTNSVKDNDLSWYARGGRHNPSTPCEASAYIGGIYDNGKVGWKKEIWFIGGYTDEKGPIAVTDPLFDRWIGWKIVIFNINNNSAVRLQSFLDNTNTNYWVKVTDFIDDGGWYAKTSDTEFFSADCNRDKDYIITKSGPIVTFRSDNLIWDFKNLSIREIQATDN